MKEIIFEYFEDKNKVKIISSDINTRTINQSTISDLFDKYGNIERITEHYLGKDIDIIEVNCEKEGNIVIVKYQNTN